MKKNKIIFSVVAVVLIIIVWIFVYKSLKTKNINDYNLLANDNQSLLDYNSKLDLPIEYANCKKDLDILNCILKVDEKVWKENELVLLNNTNLANKLDKMEQLEWKLWKNATAVMEKISSDVEDVYVNRKPAVIFDNVSCETRFCKKIIVDAKKLLIEEMFNRNLILKKSTCEKIPEQDAKDYCLNLFDQKNW